MTYVKVSLPKFKTGGAAPVPKDPNVLVYRASDVLTFPTRNGVEAVGNLTLKEGAKGVALYLTPNTISRGGTTEGEPTEERAAFVDSVSGQRPGDDKHFAGWLQEDLNEGHILITKECGDAEGTRLHGTPCNPLYFGVDKSDNKEGKFSALTWTQGQPSKNATLHYTGTIPPVADAPGSGSDGEGGI